MKDSSYLEIYQDQQHYGDQQNMKINKAIIIIKGNCNSMMGLLGLNIKVYYFQVHLIQLYKINLLLLNVELNQFIMIQGVDFGIQQLKKPNLIYSSVVPFLGSVACQKIEIYNNLTNTNDLYGVLCLDIKLQTMQNYFKFFSSSSKQLYIIDPRSQTILFDSNNKQETLKIVKLKDVEFNNTDSHDEQILFNDTLKQYSQFINATLSKIDLQETKNLYFDQKVLEYNRNGKKSIAIFNPIFIFDSQTSQIEIKDNNKQKKFYVEFAYLHIHILSDDQLREQSKKIQQFFDVYFIIVNVVFSLLGLFSIILVSIYSLRIKRMINGCIQHLTEILKNLIEEQIDMDFFDEVKDEMFLSKETLQLYHSFKGIYQILLHTSENFFQNNETETLLRLNRHIEFFKQFGNIDALGTTFNNIGSILLSQGHYFQSLESFSQSIIYAKYQIENFCKNHPLSLSSHLLSDFCYDINFNQKNSKHRTLSLQSSLNQENSYISQTPKQQESNQILQSPKKKKKKQKSEKTQDKLRSSMKLKSGFLQSSQVSIKRQNERKISFLKSSQESKGVNFNKCYTKTGFKQYSHAQGVKLTSTKYQKEEHYEQRIELIENLFYRKKNYIIALLAFQENHNQSSNEQNKSEQIIYNFWKEIKNLLNDLLIISKQLPFGDSQEIEIQVMISKCYFQLNNQFKSNQILQDCEKLLNQIKINQSKPKQEHTAETPQRQNIKKLSYFSKINNNQTSNNVKNSFNKNLPAIEAEESISNKSKSDLLNSLNLNDLHSQYQSVKQQKLIPFQEDEITENLYLNQEISNIFSQNLSHNNQLLGELPLISDYKQAFSSIKDSPTHINSSQLNIFSSGKLLKIQKVGDQILFSQKLQKMKGDNINDFLSFKSDEIDDNLDQDEEEDIKEKSSPNSLMTINKINKITKQQLKFCQNLEKKYSFKSEFHKKQSLSQSYNDFNYYNGNNTQKGQNQPASAERKNLEEVFESHRKLEMTIQNDQQLLNYLSIDSLELIINFTKAELQIRQQNYKQAAFILTQLLEKNKYLISHFPYKIILQLKQVFNSQKIISQDLNQIFWKFNPQISMKIVMILACTENNKQTFKSIQLSSNLVSNVLKNKKDQFGVLLVEKFDSYINKYMALTNVCQIQEMMSKIIHDILQLTSQNSESFYNLISDNQISDEDEEEIKQGQTDDIVENTKDFESQFQTKLNVSYYDNNIQIDVNERQQTNDLKEQIGKIVKDISQLNQIFQKNEEHKNHTLKLFKKQTSIKSEIHHSISTLSQGSFEQVQFQKGDIGTSTCNIDNYDDNHNTCIISQSEIKKNLIQIEQNYQFHISMRKTLDSILNSHIQYKSLNKQTTKKQLIGQSYDQIPEDGIYSQFEQADYVNLQQKYIIYTTNQLYIFNNKLFQLLCDILHKFNIQLILYPSQKSNNFLEKQPNSVYTYKNKDIVRIFYSHQKIINYFSNCRDTHSKVNYPTVIQHF